ncbi:9999_t:CDS:2, partial [Funneliformis geosporum]
MTFLKEPEVEEEPGVEEVADEWGNEEGSSWEDENWVNKGILQDEQE